MCQYSRTCVGSHLIYYSHLVQAPCGKIPYIIHLFKSSHLSIAATDFWLVGDHYRQVPL